jgi:hypothetical protein
MLQRLRSKHFVEALPQGQVFGQQEGGGIALTVQVNHQDALTQASQGVGQIAGDRSLPNPALVVDYCDDGSHGSPRERLRNLILLFAELAKLSMNFLPNT